jgi:NAD-dependent dihydropyrimidine dehydrogenase PreA subunit
VLLRVNSERCTGCGACQDVCPTGAIELLDGMANLRAALCQECEACLDACPQGAIESVGELLPVAAGEVVVPEHEIVVRQPAGVSSPSVPRPSLTSLGATLVHVVQEILPRVTLSALEAWERSQAAPISGVQSEENAGLSNAGRGGGYRRRRRQGRRR